MKNKPYHILVVDDEKNIRLTVSQSLESPDMAVETAVNGEEALRMIANQPFSVMLLDLKMPGIDGMEVLKKTRDVRHDIRVIIITAHGTIDSAVEAMKLGAVDFIQKPFAPVEIREIVTKVINRDYRIDKKTEDYASCLELAKLCISDRHFDAAREHIVKALSIDNSRPEALNLLGALYEIDDKLSEAQKYYRAALSLDPTYKPAQQNLSRTTGREREGRIVIDAGSSSKDAKE